MTLEEGIALCKAKSEEYAHKAECGIIQIGKEAFAKTAADYLQIMKYLVELKDLREANRVLINECDRLIKEKGELLKNVNQPCTLCGNNCQVSPVEQFKPRNGLCTAREQMYEKGR